MNYLWNHYLAMDFELNPVLRLATSSMLLFHQIDKMKA